MPRVTFETYRSRHNHLYRLWTQDKRSFSLLSPEKQWEIHGYYLFSDSLSSIELRQHFNLAAKYDPARPNRAGKVYAELLSAIEVEELRVQARLAASKQPQPPRKRGSSASFSVRPLVNPHVDIEQLARILLELADIEMRKQRAAEEVTKGEESKVQAAES